MAKRHLISVLFVLIFSLVFAPVSNAQEKASDEVESCFAYYDYGRVKAYLSSDKSSFKPGESAVIAGTINNQNSFPIREAVLYGQLKRVNPDNENFIKNGHFLVDRMTFYLSINLLPGEVKNISFTLPINESYPGGEYQIQYFVFSKNGFNYAGRNFLEEDTAGVTNFTITGENENTVYFDSDSLKIDGVSHSIRESLSKFSKGRHALTVGLTGKIPETGNILGDMAFYSYDDAFDENMLGSWQRFVLNSNNNFSLSTGLPSESGAFVLVARIEKPFKSIFKYRFVIDGSDPSPLRINDLGITNFPPSAGDRIYMCFHSSTDRPTAQYTINLSILDGQSKLLAEKNISGNFDSSVGAVSLTLPEGIDQGNFKIQGQAITDEIPNANKTVSVEYSCDSFSSSIRDISLTYSEDKPSSLMIGSMGGCGEANRTGGVIDQIKITKEGKLVKEDYNTSVSTGEYNISDLEGGDYTVEVKKGDNVKVLSIKVAKKADKAKIFKTLAIIIFAVLALLVAFRKRKKEKK